MLTEEQSLSEKHILNGLSQLSKLINELLNKKLRKVTERESAKRDIATIISNCLPFYISGLDSDVYPRHLLVRDLCALAVNEVEENAHKINKSSSSWKTSSFELTINVLCRLCEKQLLCGDYVDFLNFIFTVIESRFALSQVWVETDVANVLAKFVTASTCFIRSEHQKDIWTLVWRRLPLATDASGKLYGHYLRIARSILKHIDRTTMINGDCGQKLVADMIEKFFEVARKRNVSTWNGQIEYAFDLLSLVIDDWGIECREVILQHCIPLASLLIKKLDFSSASTNDLESAWTFFDRLFHLAVPDCKTSCLVPKEAYHLAQNACDVLQNALFSLSLNRVDYELRADYVPFFARVLVIAHTTAWISSETMDATVANYTQHAKRRKEHSVLDMVTEWSFTEGISYEDRPHLVVSCLSLGREIISRWAHRIDPDCIASMAAKLWYNRDRIKFNWQLPSFCQLLNNLLIAGAFDQLCGSNSENGTQTARSLWKFALSSALAECCFDASCSLLVSILQRFHSVIGEDDDLTDTVFDVLSRNTSAHHGPILYETVTYFLTVLEFDELKPFPGASDKKSGIDQWRFRCQVAEWLISHTRAQCDVSEPLYVLCHLHPKRSSRSELFTSTNGIEGDLELFGLSEVRSCRGEEISELPYLVIPDLVCYISQLFNECWSSHDVTSERLVSLWCSYLMFRSKVNLSFEPQCKALVNAMEDRMCELICGEDTSVLALIKLDSVNPRLISSNLLYLLSSRLSDCPSLAAYLITLPVELKVSAEIIRDVMQSIEKRLRVSDSSTVRAAAGNLLLNFIANVDTVLDLLLLLEECGSSIDRESRQRLVRRISEVIDEDLAADEYDINEAETYRRLLSSYDLKFSKASECNTVNVNCVGAYNVIRYMDSFSRRVITWDLISNLLERSGSNVILTMKVIRRVLSDPTLFYLHHLVLGIVAKEDYVLQVCEQLIPDFCLLYDCHYNSVMLAQSHLDRIPYFSVLYSLRSDQLVENFRSREVEILDIDLFTAAFFLHMEGRYETFFVSSFWKQLLVEPHALLTSLWRACKISIERKCHYLLLRNLSALVTCGLLSTVSSRMAQGFFLTLYSVISSLLHFVAESSPEQVDDILQTVNQFGCFSVDELLYLRYSLPDTKLERLDIEEDVFRCAVEVFCCKGEVEDIRIFHCDGFWRCVLKFLRTNLKTHAFNDTIIDNVLSRLMLAWDVLPFMRPHIIPIFSFGNSYIAARRNLDCHYAIRNIRDYCHLVITDYRLESADIFLSCLRILSSQALHNMRILCPPVIDHNLHEVADPACHSIASMYRELVPETDENSEDFIYNSSVEVIDDCDPMCVVDSNVLFRLIGRCACCLPKLCQILIPYVLAIDDSNAETSVQVVLQYAIFFTSDANSMSKSARLRMALCLAECVDGIGLRRLSNVNLEYHFYFHGMCALIKCCLTSNLPNYAFAVANVLYDAIMSYQRIRHLAAFDGSRVVSSEFDQLLKEIFIAFGSTSSLQTLPAELQNDDKVRVLFSRARLNWLDLISNPEATLRDLVDAYSYSGIGYSGNRRELQYALAIRGNKWNTISYPKKLISHEERLFAFLYTAGQCSSASNELATFLESIECEDAVGHEMPNLTTINDLRDFSVVHLKSRTTLSDLEALSTNFLVIFAIYLLRLSRMSTLEDIAHSDEHDMNIVISVLFKRFTDLKAFAPCMSLMKSCSSDWLTIEKCKVLIAKGELNSAEHILHVLLSSETYQNAVEIEARCLLAELFADHKNMLDEALTVLQRGIDKMEKTVNSGLRLRIFLLFYRLAARQLSGIEEHMESRAFRMREDAIREWTRQRSIASQWPPTHAARRIECELKCEKEVVEATKQRLVASAVDTVTSGLEVLRLLSEPYIKQPRQPKHRNDSILRHIFPLIDVIFRFGNEKDVVKTLRAYVANGMVPAVWIQAVSHLMSPCFSKGLLAPVIRTMIVKLIIAYPYHVLHTVLMYKFSVNHAPIVETILEEAGRRVDKSVRLRLREIIEDMTAAHVAYIQFAAAKVDDTRFFTKRQVPGSSAAQYEMLGNLSIVRLVDVLQRVPLPIVEQRCCMPGDYSGVDIVKWGSMERMCVQADGLSAPKVLRTKGSDGKLYKLIWKYEDVRQDCLVEQLFSIVNSILNGSKEAAFLRTYKVVPLDSKCGIIEFCQGTTSLKQLLCGLDLTGGLHAEEEPQDEKAITMRNILKDVAKSPVNRASATFRDACARFHPVFRHFFYRNYTTVREWTKMIDNYRRSLAQWSIVTYVVGLGDRHLSNVLFEIDTCKLVHIDLGMILEYSKRTLPIPERVPFRLTRDLLDPLLIEGTGGRLEEEAIHAMQLLRDSKHVILGLASVLLRETISNFEEIELGSDERPSFVSETAIARLRDKLNGTDDTFGQQTVQNQVRRLFAEATNVDNISRMFIGWMGFV